MANTKKYNICVDCSNGIYCPSWGEYKCSVKQMRMPFGMKACDHYNQQKKGMEERKCHCITCMAEGYVDDDSE